VCGLWGTTRAISAVADDADLVVLFSEEFIALAILRLVEMEKAVVEGAGAIGLAAVLGDYVPELKGKKYVYVDDLIKDALYQLFCLL